MDKRSKPVADAFIKPNDRLTSFERLEIYNRQYWFRIIDCFYDDYPGLRAVLGERKFSQLCRAYLAKYHKNEATILSNLVTDGSAEISYTDPLGRFNVYNVRQYLEHLKKPTSLRDCRIF